MEQINLSREIRSDIKKIILRKKRKEIVTTRIKKIFCRLEIEYTIFSQIFNGEW